MAAATPDTLPTITINGDPVIMRVGDSYADLGATPSRAWHVEPDQCFEAIIASVTYPFVTDVTTAEVL